ncbi:MAG: protein tyrosine phosphatase family protein [Pseudomonadota bacterium]
METKQPESITLALAWLLVLMGLTAKADPLTAIPNHIVYPEGFASAGQPQPEHYADIAAAGFERIVYLAYADQPEADVGNDRAAHEAGLDFVQIPVRWDGPRHSDFASFAALLNASEEKVYVHCQLNYRASAFSFLYRVIYQNVPVASAKTALDSIWRPNETWLAFMRSTLARHGFELDCDGCDWSQPPARD